jgi:hypothetical protein
MPGIAELILMFYMRTKYPELKPTNRSNRESGGKNN